MSLVRSTFRLFSKHQTQISLQLVNKLHLSNVNSQQKRQVEEVRIPVPWGHLAAKWWGPQDKRPILCLHGWQVIKRYFKKIKGSLFYYCFRKAVVALIHSLIYCPKMLDCLRLTFPVMGILPGYRKAYTITE